MFTYEFIPPLAVVAMQFYDGAEMFAGGFQEPLRQAVTEVMAPSFRKNFEAGGRPTWEPLSEATVIQKAQQGFEGDPLVRTGALRDAASSVDIWTIGEEQAQVDSLGADVWYGAFHQSGTIYMPQREWAVMQPEDQDDIEEIFSVWCDHIIDDSGIL